MAKINTYGTCGICNMAYWKKNLIKVKELLSYIPLGHGKDDDYRWICINCSRQMDSGEGILLPQYEANFPIL